MARTKQTARVRVTAKGQGTSAVGADHQPIGPLTIGQLLAKLPDSSKSNTNVVSTPVKSAGKTVPTQRPSSETKQATQPYGGLTQDSRRKQKRLETKSCKVGPRTDSRIPPALRYARENAAARRKTADATA